jgi:hypothetical protein
MSKFKNILKICNDTQLQLSDESLNSFKISLGVKSNYYENLNEVTSGSYNISTSQYITVNTNDLGFCEVLINPVFLISRKMLSVLQKNNEVYVSNIFVGNQEGKRFGEMQKVFPIQSGNITEQDFDVYKFQKLEIYSDFDEIAETVPDAKDNLDCDFNKVKIQLIDGKSINIISSINYIFKNYLMSDKLNNEISVKSSKEFSINDGIVYTFLDRTLGIMDYIKNGYNSQDENPLLINNFDHIQDVITKQFIKYEQFLSGNDVYNFTAKYQDNIQKLNYALNLTNSNVLQNNIYNQASQRNDKMVRILIKTKPYTKVKFLLNSYFTIKLNNQKIIIDENLPEFRLKTIMSFSDFEKNFKKVINILISAEPSLDPAYLTKLVYENYDENGPNSKLSTFINNLWLKAKTIAKPIVESVENVINQVTTVVDFISGIVVQEDLN